MSFQAKNFAYVTKGFGTFLNEVHAGGRQYLRSISAEQPSKLPANLATDFPTLQQDFRLPECLSLVSDNVHSSPLRISGPVTMWLHYDVSTYPRYLQFCSTENPNNLPHLNLQGFEFETRTIKKQEGGGERTTKMPKHM